MRGFTIAVVMAAAFTLTACTPSADAGAGSRSSAPSPSVGETDSRPTASSSSAPTPSAPTPSPSADDGGARALAVQACATLRESGFVDATIRAALESASASAARAAALDARWEPLDAHVGTIREYYLTGRDRDSDMSAFSADLAVLYGDCSDLGIVIVSE